MPGTFTYTFDTPSFKGDVTVNTGLFIGGEWVDPVEGGDLIEVHNPATEEVLTKVAGGSKADVDRAVEAAKKTYKTKWGLRTSGRERGRMLEKLADLIEQNADMFTALESLNTGKGFGRAKYIDIGGTVTTLRYYAGWADKIQGKTLETNETKFAYTRHEPYGVVGQIVPWNFPLCMVSWKIAPALATGNAIVLKPSEITPLTALKLAEFINEAGFPPGTVNIVNGYGWTVGQAIAEHPQIDKVAFTGSTLTGRKILKAAAETNLKEVTLELGGKSPTIIFDDADIEQAVKWATSGIFFNMGQVCTAGSRIFVQEGIYDRVLEAFANNAKALAAMAGDPFSPATQHGPQISQTQFDRVMSYIESGKEQGARLVVGGERLGEKGYFIHPTVFTDVSPDMKIVREEIFGPVGVIIKFKTEEEAIELANDTIYGLAAHIFTENTSRAIRVAHAIEAGSVSVNCANSVEISVPFGGYKQSGMGRELGEYAIQTYTQVKGVHINIGMKL